MLSAAAACFAGVVNRKCKFASTAYPSSPHTHSHTRAAVANVLGFVSICTCLASVGFNGDATILCDLFRLSKQLPLLKRTVGEFGCAFFFSCCHIQRAIVIGASGAKSEPHIAVVYASGGRTV